MAATTIRPDNLTGEPYVYSAKLAERYEDVVKYMQKLVTETTPAAAELTVKEPNLPSVG